MLGAEQDTVWLLDKESGLHTEVPLEAVDLEMTPPKLALPTPPSGESEKEGDRANLNEEVRHRGQCKFTSLFKCGLVLCRNRTGLDESEQILSTFGENNSVTKACILDYLSNLYIPLPNGRFRLVKITKGYYCPHYEAKNNSSAVLFTSQSLLCKKHDSDKVFTAVIGLHVSSTM